MSKTPDVVSGQLTMDAWGNEIRNRTIQVFASTAEHDGWAAPDGSFAVVTANRYLYQRIAGVWRLHSAPRWTGAVSGTVGAGGSITFTHGLGLVPAWAKVQPRSPSSWGFHFPGAMTATTVTVLCRTTAGADMSGPITAYLEVGL